MFACPRPLEVGSSAANQSWELSRHCLMRPRCLEKSTSLAVRSMRCSWNLARAAARDASAGLLTPDKHSLKQPASTAHDISTMAQSFSCTDFSLLPCGHPASQDARRQKALNPPKRRALLSRAVIPCSDAALRACCLRHRIELPTCLMSADSESWGWSQRWSPASKMAMLVLRSACGVVGCAASPTSTMRPYTHCFSGSRS